MTALAIEVENLGKRFGERDVVRRVSFSVRAGELVALTSGWNLNRFDGSRFQAVRPALPERILAGPASARREILQDHLGEWWVSTREGLYRFPADMPVAATMAPARTKRTFVTRLQLVKTAAEAMPAPSASRK